MCVYLTGDLPCGNSGPWFSFHFAALPSPGPQNTLLGGMFDIQLTEIDRQRQGDRHRERQRQRATERETYMGGPYGSAPEVLSFTIDHIPLARLAAKETTATEKLVQCSQFPRGGRVGPCRTTRGCSRISQEAEGEQGEHRKAFTSVFSREEWVWQGKQV